jgi:hypothetical protein
LKTQATSVFPVQGKPPSIVAGPVSEEKLMMHAGRETGQTAGITGTRICRKPWQVVIAWSGK